MNITVEQIAGEALWEPLKIRHFRAGGNPAIPIRFDCQAVNETGEPLRQAQESLRSLLFFCAWRLAELETVKAGGIMP